MCAGALSAASASSSPARAGGPVRPVGPCRPADTLATISCASRRLVVIFSIQPTSPWAASSHGSWGLGGAVEILNQCDCIIPREHGSRRLGSASGAGGRHHPRQAGGPVCCCPSAVSVVRHGVRAGVPDWMSRSECRLCLKAWGQRSASRILHPVLDRNDWRSRRSRS